MSNVNVVPIESKEDLEESSSLFRSDPKAATERHEQKRRVSSSEFLTEEGKRQSLYKPGELTPAEDVDCAQHPVDPITGETNVSCYVLVKKIRSIDAIQSSVNGSYIFTLRWLCPHLKGKRVNKEALWTPTLSLINYDEIEIRPETPWFYPKTGDCRQVIFVSGTVSNEQNLRYFPFDMDDMKLLFVVELGTGDQHARLHWDYERGADSSVNITPDYVCNQMKEWHIHRKLTSVRRIKKIKNLTGHMTGIELRINLSRRYNFYLTKICSLLWLMTASSWYSFFMVEGPEKLIDRAVFNERLNFSAALLLTSVSFLYLSGDSIPKLSYLTVFDFIMIHSFLCQFIVMIESFFVFQMTEQCLNNNMNNNGTTWCDPTLIRLVDQWSTILVPISYIVVQIGFIVYSLYQRNVQLQKTKQAKYGVEPCLLCHSGMEEKQSGKKWWAITTHDQLYTTTA